MGSYWRLQVRIGPNLLEVSLDTDGGEIVLAFPDRNLRVWDLRLNET
jgi:hypothetical protein